MYDLTYLFSRNNFLQFQFKKNIFLKFDQFSKSEWDSRDGDGDSLCDRHVALADTFRLFNQTLNRAQK